MAKKSNIRSIRFSDELAELIDQQIGDTFTEKFENLITKCVWELPQKEKELEQIEAQIKIKREQLKELWKSNRQWEQTIQNITTKLYALENTLKQESELLDK